MKNKKNEDLKRIKRQKERTEEIRMQTTKMTRKREKDSKGKEYIIQWTIMENEF